VLTSSLKHTKPTAFKYGKTATPTKSKHQHQAPAAAAATTTNTSTKHHKQELTLMLVGATCVTSSCETLVSAVMGTPSNGPNRSNSLKCSRGWKKKKKKKKQEWCWEWGRRSGMED
jgi:hypothetical protein